MKLSKLVGGLVAGFIAMSFSLSALAAVPLEAKLGGAAVSDAYWGMTHTPRIDFTKIALTYSKGKFSGASSSTSAYTMVKPDGTTFGYKGTFKLTASISSTGTFSGGSFSFTSSDSQFGFGKNSKGQAITGNVFSGSLTGFGWSNSAGMLEFGEANLTGKVCDWGWCTQAERMKFQVSSSSLKLLNDCVNGKNGVTSWSSTASGTAVIPVPAAAWLLGSGLLGLAGFAKRRKS